MAKKRTRKSVARGFMIFIGRSHHVLWTLLLFFCLYLFIWYVGVPTIPNSFLGSHYISNIGERYDILQYKNGTLLYVMNEENICGNQSYVKAVDLLIAVVTATKYFDRREAIRKTWGGIVKTNPRIKIVFFLGVFEAYDEGKLWAERAKNHDMVLLNYTDTYEELTFKSISMMRWASEFCEHASFVLKTDDDALLNVDNMLNDLTEAHLKHEDFMMCFVWKGAPVIRMKRHKYYVPYEAYRKRTYPNYCGGLYAFTGNLSRALYLKSLGTPFIPMEDVYMSGMVASQLKIPLVHNSGFVLDQVRIKHRKRKINPCIYKNISIYVEYSPRELELIWEKYDAKLC